MPLSKCIHTEWDAGEAMRLRQILIDYKREVVAVFYRDQEANTNALIYNIHVKRINDVKELIRRIEEPLVDQRYVEFSEPQFLLMLPTGGKWSLSDPGGVIGDNPVGSGKI